MSIFKKILKPKKKKDRPVIRTAFEEDRPIQPDLKTNVSYVKNTLKHAPDLMIRNINIGSSNLKAVVMALDGLIDSDRVQMGVMKSLFSNKDVTVKNLQSIEDHLLYALDISHVKSMNAAINALLTGNVILFLENETKALQINLKTFETRSVEEPKSEPTVRGPHEGFTEAISINFTLIRRRLVDPNLRFEEIILGEKTQTKIYITYIDDIADPEIIEEVRSRLKKIKTASVLESGYIEQYIEDAPQSLFPTVGNTEKPDRVVAKLLEGRVAILVDGTPVALTVPYLFVEGFQAAEDYYSRPYYTSLVRLIRFTSFWISIFLPAFYVATQNFHKEMLPTELLASIAAAREGVPFPLIMELTMMLIVFEILREAGVRMPRAIGQAVSIVGALILGEAAVDAGIVGTPTIIIVAVAGITTFIITPFADAATLLRLLMLIPAGSIGLYGLLLATLALAVHLASITSMKVPYLAPIAPLILRDWKDVFVRLSHRRMKKMPQSIPVKRNIRRYKVDS